MRDHPRPFDIVHVSSAHPWTDNRVHGRAAASAAGAGYRTALIAVATSDVGPDRDWSTLDPATGVYVRRIVRRRRWLRVVVSSIVTVRAAVSSRAAVVHLHDPELLWAVPVLMFLRRSVVYDAHEDLPTQVLGKEYLGRLGRRGAAAVAGAAVAVARRADVVVAATPAIAGRFDQGRTVVVRNVPRQHCADEAAPPLHRRPAAAVYLGSLSRDRGIDVLTAIATSPLRPAGWSIVTAGPIDRAVDADRFTEAVADGAIDHRGVLRPDDARALLTTARVGLLPLLPTPAYAVSIPTKLFEYMAAGLAVVATDIPFWRELLDGVDCATWVPPGDPDAVVRALRRYDERPELLARHAAAGRALVEQRYRWDQEERVLLDVYRSLFGATPFPAGGRA